MRKRVLKKRVLKKDLRQHMSQKLKHDHIPFKMIEQNDILYCSTELSSRAYHRYIESAMCEKQRKNKKAPVHSLNDLLYKPPKRSFILLEKDRGRALNIL